MNILKSITIICVVVLSVSQCFSQIGIQTEYPKALFHIDGAGDNPKNATSILTTSQLQNDIAVNTVGNIGVGTITPQSKLDITHDPTITGDTYALRLTPGYGAPAILVLQSDGKTVKWEANPSLGKKAQFRFNPIKVPYVNSLYSNFTKLNGDLNLSGTNAIAITTEGRYLLTVDMMGLATLDSRTSPPLQASIYIYLYKYEASTGSTTLVDGIEHYMSITEKVGSYMAFPAALYAGYCKPSDRLYIAVRPSIAFGISGSAEAQNGNVEFTNTNPSIVTVYNI